MERDALSFLTANTNTCVGSSFNRRKRSRNTLQEEIENIPSVTHARQTTPGKVSPATNPLSLDICTFKPIDQLKHNCMNKNSCRNQRAEQKRRFTLMSDTNIKSSATRSSGICNDSHLCTNICNNYEAQPTGFKRARSFVNELPPRARARPAHLRGRLRRRKTRRINCGFDAEEEEDSEEQGDEVVHMPGSVSPESVFDHPPVQQCRGTRPCPFPQQRGMFDTRRMRIDNQEVPVSVDGGAESHEMDHDFALMKNNMWLKRLHWMRVLRIQKQRIQDERRRLYTEKTNTHLVDEQQQHSCELLRQLYIEKLRRKSSMQICDSSS